MFWFALCRRTNASQGTQQTPTRLTGGERKGIGGGLGIALDHVGGEVELGLALGGAVGQGVGPLSGCLQVDLTPAVDDDVDGLVLRLSGRARSAVRASQRRVGVDSTPPASVRVLGQCEGHPGIAAGRAQVQHASDRNNNVLAAVDLIRRGRRASSPRQGRGP
jgi:hypothetical protein